MHVKKNESISSMYIMFESGSKHCRCLVGLSTQDEHDKSQLKGNLTKMSVNFNSRHFRV